MAVCKSNILSLLVVLSLSIAAGAADDKSLDFVTGKTYQSDIIDDDSTSDTNPFDNEEDYIENCSDLCSKHPCQRRCEDCYDDCCIRCNPPWTATAEALFLRPSPTSGQQLLFDPLQGSNLLNSSDMAFPFEAGPRLSLIRHRCCGWDFELNYFGILGPKARADFPTDVLPEGVGNLIVDDEILLPVNEVGFEEYYMLYSSEFNFRRPVNDWLTTLVGFRWVEFYDNYQAQGTEAIESTPFVHTINTHNHIYGFQIGEDALLFEATGRFRINGLVKIGIFYNAADQNSNFYDSASFGYLSAVANGNHVAFLGELGLIGSYQLTKHVALRGGYQVMWIEGVALAPRQIPVTNLGAGTAGIDITGGLFAHGANAGLEIKW